MSTFIAAPPEYIHFQALIYWIYLNSLQNMLWKIEVIIQWIIGKTLKNSYFTQTNRETKSEKCCDRSLLEYIYGWLYAVSYNL